MDPLVIKLGGALLENTKALNDLFHAIADYRHHSDRIIVIVHGGGCLVDRLMQRLDLPAIKSQGQRITPKEHIDLIVGVLAGMANKRLMAKAKKHGLLPLGLSLSDGDITKVEFMCTTLGYVGTAAKGNDQLLKITSSRGYLPIISSIGITDEGDLLNVNGDNAAIALAATLNADLLLLSDVIGVLDENAVHLKHIDSRKAECLIKTGVIQDGMITKVTEALNAAKRLNKTVSIAGIQKPDQLIALFNGEGIRTQLSS